MVIRFVLVSGKASPPSRDQCLIYIYIYIGNFYEYKVQVVYLVILSEIICKCYAFFFLFLVNMTSFGKFFVKCQNELNCMFGLNMVTLL
jgi:hypothetical protein